jgi:hypothetical protein
MILCLHYDCILEAERILLSTITLHGAVEVSMAVLSRGLSADSWRTIKLIFAFPRNLPLTSHHTLAIFK